jgi:DNA-binding IclR family transcriptional regulator
VAAVTDDDPARPSDAVQTVARASDLLSFVAGMAGKGARLTDVVAETGLGKSTAYRLLTALVQAGLLDQDPATRAYHLGFKLIGLGEIAANRLGLADLGLDAIGRLAQTTGDTVYLSVRRGSEAVCLARASGDFPIKILTLNVGDHSPLGSGAGSLALLAFLPDPEIQDIVQANAARAPGQPGLEPGKLLQLVAETRAQGYARTDGRIVAGMSSVGVPVLSSKGLPIAAISLAAISDRLDPVRAKEVLNLLRTEAAALAARLEQTLGILTPRTIEKVVAAARG